MSVKRRGSAAPGVFITRPILAAVTGTVTAYRWADPHVMIALDVEANGTIEKWNVGGSNKKYSAVNGWDRNTLKPGDVITAIGYRFRDGSNAAQLQKIVMASGKEMYLYGPPALRTPLGDEAGEIRSGGLSHSCLRHRRCSVPPVWRLS